MSNFSKEERVAFDELLDDFEDYLVLSKTVNKYQTNQEQMERSNDTIWRPQPYISQTFEGADQSANFKSYTQLSVPSSISRRRSAPWIMTDLELRDMLQEKRLYESAKQKLASDINLAIMDVIAEQASLVVPITTAPGEFDDVAQCESIMNEQGVQMYDRHLALSTRTNNGMAGNLQTESRSFGNSKSDTAYDRAMINSDIANFNILKLDYANRITAAAGAGITIDTQVGAGNFFIPSARSTAASGESANVDNRFQTITVSSTTDVVAGDCLTIDGVEAVHHITKRGTGQLKTFRVISNDGATTLTITPPIISTQGGTDAEFQYQNVIVTEAAAAPIVFLNTTAADINPFWTKNSIEILPGRIATQSNAGPDVMRGTTENGVELVIQKFQDIDTGNIKYRVDTLFGVVNLQPQMTGILLFNQA